MAVSSITYRENFSLGETLNVRLERTAPPFATASISEFVKTFKEREEKLDKVPGTFTFNSELCKDMKQTASAMGVGGALNLSYGPICGDAHVQFAKDNSNDLLSLTLVMSAEQTGVLRQNELTDFNKLELSETVLTQIHEGMQFDEFREKYGEYMIVGWEYGGKFTYVTKYEVDSAADKISVEGGLSIKMNHAGLSVGGKVDGNYSSKDVKEKSGGKSNYRIDGSCDTKVLNGDDGIISLLSKISNPWAKTEEIVGVNGKLQSQLQKFFAESPMKKRAIVIKMDTIKSVSDAFNVKNSKLMQLFCMKINPLYFTIDGILNVIKKIDENWKDKDDEMDNKIIRWKRTIRQKKDFMDHIGIDLATLYEYAKRAHEAVMKIHKTPKDDAKEEHEMDKDITEIDEDMLERQFKKEIFNPYNEIMEQKAENQKEKEKNAKQTLSDLEELKKQLQIEQKQKQIEQKQKNVLDRKLKDLEKKENEEKELEIYDGGIYIFKNVISGKVIDGTTCLKGANVHQWEAHGGDNQLWIVNKQKNGYYTVQSKRSGMYWNISLFDTKNNANLDLYSMDGYPACKEFKFIHVGDRQYVIEARHSGKLLHVEWAKKDNGTNIRQWKYHTAKTASHWFYIQRQKVQQKNAKNFKKCPNI
eukprot:422653_1